MNKKNDALPKGVDVLPSGSYRLRRTVNGQMYTDVDPNLETLMKRFEQKKSDFLLGRRVSLDSWTVEAFFCEWMSKVAERSLKLVTIRNRESMFYTHVYPVFGKRYMDEISTLEITSFLEKLANSGLKPGTISNIQSMLRCMFDAAVSMRVITASPVISVKSESVDSDRYLLAQTPHVPEIANCAAELEEIAEILRIMHSTEYYNYIRFALLTGLRGGECAALRSSRLVDNKLIIDATLSKLYSRTYDRMCFNLRTTKSRSGNRVLILDDAVKDVIEEQLKVNEENQVKYSWEPCEILVGDKETTAVLSVIDDFIFRKRKSGVPFSVSAIDALMRFRISAYNERSERKLPVISMHNLRHTFASFAREQRVEPEVLQRILGHSSFEVTNKTYINVKPETLHAAVKYVKQDISNSIDK